jgi:hypothetical protein
MKRFLIFGLVFLVIVCANAQVHTGHRLVVFSPKGDKFKLTANTLAINEKAQDKVGVSNLQGVEATVELAFENPAIPSIKQTVPLANGDYGWNAVFYKVIKKVVKGKTTTRLKISSWKPLKEEDPKSKIAIAKKIRIGGIVSESSGAPVSRFVDLNKHPIKIKRTLDSTMY